MMNIDTTRALIPVQVALKPVSAPRHQGSPRFRYEDHSRGGMRFVGYGLNGVDRNYGPSGEGLKDDTKSGGIVDIYV